MSGNVHKYTVYTMELIWLRRHFVLTKGSCKDDSVAESEDGSHDADDLQARLPDPHKKEYSRSNVTNDKHRCDDDVTGCVANQPSTNKTSQAGGHAPNYDRHTHKLNSNTLCDVHL